MPCLIDTPAVRKNTPPMYALSPTIPGNRPRRRSQLLLCPLATALMLALLPLPALANCVTSGVSTVCDSTPVNPWTTILGTGAATAANSSLTLQSGATISVGDSNAVSYGNNATILLMSGSTIKNLAVNANGLYSTGGDTVETNNNSTITVQQGAQILALGTQTSAEAINVEGTGNTVTNSGLIMGNKSAAIWFQNTSGLNTVVNTSTGVIQATGSVIGSSGNGAVNFTNQGKVIGNLTFAGGNDVLSLFSGSSISGSFNGGGGSNTINLLGTGNDSLPGAIQNFQFLNKQDTGTWTLTGSITGGLAVDVNQGTLVLSGNNAGFTGKVQVDAAGTLQGSSGTLPPTVTDNGLVHFVQLAAGTYAGLISGAGAVSKDGAGTLTLSGANTYSGGTLFNGGAINVASNAALGAPGGSLTFNGGALQLGASLTLSPSRTITLNTAGGTIDTNGFAGELDQGIVGTGALTKAGAGTLTLTGSSTYTGGTTIGAGTLQLGNGGASGSIQGDVTDNGALAFDRSDTVTFPGIISGTGAISQIGGGTTVLTAESTYTGGTTIAAGTLQLGNGGTTGSILGNVTDNATLAFDRSDTATYAGFISGTGAVNQIGSGMTILTADNTYTGGTTIAAGTLQLGNGGTTGSIQGNVTDNAMLAFNRSDTTTFAGLISGSGTVTQAGSGTTVLTADSTYTGGTTISAGTLQLGNGGTTGSIVGDVTDNAMLAFDRIDTTTFAGTISGSGALDQNGSGTTILTGNNTYTGLTTISAGTLQLGDGGTSGSIVGDVLDNAALVVNRTDTVTLPGVISGTGTLTQAGTGTTVLTGDNTYSGGTTIGAGTLQLGNGGTSGSVVGNIADNANLIFDRSDVLTYGDVISGTGTVTQAGSGTTVLTNANTYAGATTIAAGTLQLDGSIISATSIEAGATLSGLGQVQGDVNSAGTIAPGDPDTLGALTIAGNYIAASDPATLTLRTVINAGGPGNQVTDRLLITGDSSGQTLATVLAQPGGQAQLTGNTNVSGISLIQVGGASPAGSFALGTSVNQGPYQYGLFRFPNDVTASSELDPKLAAQGTVNFTDYRLQTIVVQPPGRRLIPPATPPAGNPPANAPPIPSQGIFPTAGTGGETSGGLDSSGAYVPAGLPIGEGPNGEKAGEPLVVPQVQAFRAAPSGALQYGYALIDDLHLRRGEVAQESPEENWESFVRARGWSGSFSGQVPGFDQNFIFVQAGIGRLFDGASAGDRVQVGAIASVGNSNITVQKNGARVRFDAFSLGATATYQSAQGWYADGVLQETLYRDVDFRNVEQGPVANTKGHGELASLEFGYPFHFANTWVIEPRALFAYQRVDFDNFNDIDDVSFRLDRANSAIERLGIRIQDTFDINTSHGAWLLSPYATLDYVHDMSGPGRENLGGIDFILDNTGSSAQGDLGINAQINKSMAIYVDVGHVVKRGGTGAYGNEANVGFRYTF